MNQGNYVTNAPLTPEQLAAIEQAIRAFVAATPSTDKMKVVVGESQRDGGERSFLLTIRTCGGCG